MALMSAIYNIGSVILQSSINALGEIYIVPVYGYTAVCICEPTTWVICMVFIVIGTFCYRREFRKAEQTPEAV